MARNDAPGTVTEDDTRVPVRVLPRGVPAASLNEAALLARHASGATTVVLVLESMGERRVAATAGTTAEAAAALLESPLVATNEPRMKGVDDEGWDADPVSRALDGARFAAAAPVVDATGHRWGALVALDTRARKRASRVLDPLELSARQVASHLRAESERQGGGVTSLLRSVFGGDREAEAQRFLAEASHALASSLDPQRTLEALANLAVPRLADWCLVDLLDEGRLVHAAIAHHDVDTLRRAQELARAYPDDGFAAGAVAEATRTGKPILVPRIDETRLAELARGEAHLEGLRVFHFRSLLVVPLVGRTGILGALTLVTSGSSARELGEKDLSLAEQVARRASVAIEHAVLFRETESMRARLSSLVEGVDAVLWEADAADHRFTFVSQRAERMLGHPVREWLASPAFWRGLIHPLDRDDALEAREANVREGSDHELEYRLVAADGRVLWVRDIVYVSKDASGAPASLRGVMVDVTARKSVEEALARLAAIVQDSDDGIYGKSLDGRIVEWNPGAERLYGYSRAEIIGKPIAMLLPPERVPEEKDILRRIGAGERVPSFDTERLRKGGVRIPVSLTVSPIRDERGRVVGASGVSRDITARREMERQLRERAEQLSRLAAALERSNRELDQFAYVTSHDLKAPLRGIANLSRWIEEDLGPGVPEDVARNLGLLRGRVHRMEALINAILEYSRIGRVRQRVESVELHDLLRETVELLAPPPSFRVHLPQEGPTLHAERMRLQQVFMNLIGNAIKHHGGAQGNVWVEWEAEDSRYRFRVRDDGKGISPRFHDKVFTIFQTLEARDKVEGTGVGLALVKKIVESQGGTVSIESDEGKGATFTFTWPKTTKGETNDDG